MKRIGLILLAILLMAFPMFSQHGTWTQKADIPTPRWVTSSCELDGKIYVIGGAQTLNSSINTLEVYDPATDTWDITKTDMPTTRAELCVAAVNGKIYAIGGAPSHEGTALGVVEEYDPSTDSWVTKAPMLTARKGAACGVIDNKIYVAGGSATTYSPTNILEVYDPATDSWTAKANMVAARYYPQGAVLNDTFYVSGGLIGSPWTGQIAVQIYDPVGDTWSLGTPLNTGRVGHTTNSLNGKIYAIGGDKQPPVVENVEEYDPVVGIWTVIDPTPDGMISHKSSVYGDEIYVFSGSITNIHDLTLTSNVYSYSPPPSVSIPDTAFLYALIDEGVDINEDSLISFGEAAVVTSISATYRGIHDITGIEAFINLESLELYYNQIDSLDISNNTGLLELDVNGNNLTHIDVSMCSSLIRLICQNNSLSSLDVSYNNELEILECHSNMIETLDLSENRSLKFLWCSEMPSLGEVCVWDAFVPIDCIPEPFVLYGTDTVCINASSSPNVCFQTDCDGICDDIQAPSITAVDTLYQPDYIEATSTEDGVIYLVLGGTEKDITVIRGACIDSVDAVANTPVEVPLSGLENGIYWLFARDSTGNISEPKAFTITGIGIVRVKHDHVKLYPNPTNALIIFEAFTSDLYDIEITSMNGQLIFNQEIQGITHQLDLSSFRKGIYFISIRSKDYVTTRKIVKL